MAEKSVLEKLLLKPGVTLGVVGSAKGAGVPEGAKKVSRGPAEAVLLYATNASELEATFAQAAARLAPGGRLWIAYPKAGQLGTDLSRDVLARDVQQRGFEPVRQVALDETWSALWFKPAAEVPSRRSTAAAKPRPAAKTKSKSSAAKPRAAGRRTS